MPLNRSEGDLEIHLEMDNEMVSEARSVGTMYRGFENLLKGRAPLDGLVITPRICGICSTSHLKAAVKALDMIAEVSVPDDAIRVRNLTLMAEQLQNDLRHTFLLFTPDFTSPAYRKGILFLKKPSNGTVPLKAKRLSPPFGKPRRYWKSSPFSEDNGPIPPSWCRREWSRFPDKMTSANAAACWPIFVNGMNAGFWDVPWSGGRMSKPRGS